MCGYHRFQQAEFSQSVLAELRRLFEARRELLHQKVALHAYTALLSRLQVESYLYCLLKGERRMEKKKKKKKHELRHLTSLPNKKSNFLEYFCVTKNDNPLVI